MSGSDEQIRNMINELEDLPGKWDKDAAWQKLQMRREPAPVKTRKRITFGIAVATIACLIAITILVNQTAEDPSIVHIDVVPAAKTSPIKNLGTVTANNEIAQRTITNVTPPKHNKTERTANNYKDNKPATHDTLQSSAPLLATADSSNTTIMADTQQQQIVVSIEKKKMKTVHIHDLTNEVAPFRPVKQENIFNILSRGNRENTVSVTTKPSTPAPHSFIKVYSKN